VSDTSSDFISYLTTAMSNIALYSKEHESVTDLIDKALATLDNLYVDDTLNITLLGRSLIFNDTPVMAKGIHIENFRKRLRTNGIEKIIIKKGISTGELREFISRMALKGETPGSSEHILVGTVQVRFKSAESEVQAMMDENISVIKDVYQGVSRFKKLDVFGLEEAVVGFISALKREANILRIVSPVKSYSEYTYVHAANVSTLTLFQSEFLGLKGENLYDAGLAGLLHDVGKMFISQEILEKQAKLNESEWHEMKRHPIQGALYLSKLQDVPKLAVIATFEHHMKFNGGGYPATKKRGRRQHIISQLVAISDFFDAMRTERPYRKALEVQTIIGIMKKSAGYDFNPQLVDNFLKAIHQIGVI
jgi:HD-GYP domain-containing protein (c-di-GMP phosphodiesterase class II)